MFSPQLLAQIRQVALELPPPTLELVADFLSSHQDRRFCDFSKGELLQQIPKSSWRQVIVKIIDLWQTQAPNLDGSALATALRTAAYCEQQNQEKLSVEIVWTGPHISEIPARRTDQVLLQLIQTAQQELLLISFAVYKVPEIATALVAALNRGVKLRIIAETTDSDQGKIQFGVKSAFGPTILNKAQVFVWPYGQRPTNPEGRFGSLHIKCAIADQRHLFISSANLTEYALALNMEIGLLVHSQDLARQVTEQIDGLIHQGILVPE